ncbi:MAG: hypothetical protein F4147_12295 [Gammaproteobacteria bacterium]|nr:hypothetical protein [Gammaproteobacteria bacterium]
MLPDAPVRMPQLDDFLPEAVQAARECLRNALADHDVGEEALLELAMNLCDVQSCLGSTPPPYKLSQERIAAYRRDTAIVNGFQGNNYTALAERYDISERTVRRIINHHFYERKNS